MIIKLLNEHINININKIITRINVNNCIDYKKSNEYNNTYNNTYNELDEKGQVAAEMLLLMGGIIVIVLVAIFFYKDYLISIGENVGSNEIAQLDEIVYDISSKFA